MRKPRGGSAQGLNGLQLMMDRDPKSASHARAREETPKAEPTAPTAPTGPSEDGHLHRCRKHHRWFHTGPSSTSCTLTRDDAGWGDAGAIDAAACPMCSGREYVLVRGPHEHRCGFCDGAWRHQGRCAEGPWASCPWCASNSSTLDTPAVRGPHLHECPRCYGRWRHGGRCRAPAVSETIPCVMCARRRARRARRSLIAVATASVALVTLIWSVNAPPRR